MSNSNGRNDSQRGGSSAFTTTHWSVVLTAARGDSPQAQEAWENLCLTYWYPIYAFLRRKGNSREDAEDITQGFFVRLIRKRALHEVHPHKGKFRNFLLASVQHYARDLWKASTARIRGGECQIISFDAQTAEERYSREPVDELTPEKVYERRWAITVVEAAIAQLKAEFDRAGRSALFEALRGILAGEKTEEGYAQIATKLGTTASAVRCSVPRLRSRFGELVRAEVAKTIDAKATRGEVDDEVRYLMSIVGR